MNKTRKLISSESVTEGHPDKVCDQISDGILDAMLKNDSESRAAVECFCTNGLVVVGGEVSTSKYINIDETVRNILKQIGYNGPDSDFDCDSIAITSVIHGQSSEIAMGVDEQADSNKEQGAGDQGIMYGYASDETPEYMPLAIVLANRLSKRLAELRKDNTLSYLKPDGKTQVTLEYQGEEAKRAEAVVVAACHRAEVTLDQVRQDILEQVIKPMVGNLMDADTKIHINATGAFTFGGPAADTGLTGRKIIVDTYGGFARHGGGCFSGKDASKVDRSGAYMARYVAKNIVAAGLARKCEIQVAYAIGVARPVSINIDCFETNTISEEGILKAIEENFDFRPKSIIEKLALKQPIFFQTAAYGHFGRNEFNWEKLDRVDDLKKYLNK
jgi:S-adenosylmethionine synthetase